MAERSLVDTWRLIAASFREAPAGQRWAERLAGNLSPALDRLVFSLGEESVQTPRELDNEHIGSLLGEVLPGRLTGREPWAKELPDLLEDFLVFTAADQSLSTAWEWSRAVGMHRPRFEVALKNPSRPAMGGAVKHQPDVRPSAKLGRNDPCFCGSGVKYKHCCGKMAK